MLSIKIVLVTLLVTKIAKNIFFVIIDKFGSGDLNMEQ